MKEYIEFKIEIGRTILNNAVAMNLSKDLILKISQKLDKYLVEYYQFKQLNERKAA